ncbi:MAG TPA: putative lipid II flippase FtsW [Acidimicrobiales bacterium]|nr:putative lipid II flippase FtsW [Acidimicrobiales bacterium]
MNRTERRPTDDVWASRRRHPTARPVAPPRVSKTFVGLLAVVATLNLLGLVMVLSASSVSSLDTYGSSWYVVMRQAMWMAIGVAGCIAVMRVDYHRWRRLALPALGLSGILLALVLVPGIGTSANGATRWIGYGPLTLQPSELAKLTVLVFVADLLARRAAWMSDARVTLVPVLVVFGTTGLLLMLQPNLGTTLVLGAIVLSVLYVAGTPLAPLGALSAAGALLATVLALAAPYRRARVMAFLDPWKDYQDTGYQTIQSLVGIASGGITGTGLGQSRAKWGFLPYAHTDFIFAIIGEELGLVGALVVVALFVAFCVLGARAALLAPDRFGMLLAAGVTTWFGVQAFINIGAVIGILPITGVPLPFVSYGGTSLMINLVAAGLLLNVARQGQPPTPRRPAPRRTVASTR